LQRSSFRKPDRIIAAREIGFKTPRARQAAMPLHHAAMNSRRLMPAAKNEATDSNSSKRVLFKSEGRFRLGVSTIVECRLWVKLRRTQYEYMFSGLRPKADIDVRHKVQR
jgi:hypothetical protein